MLSNKAEDGIPVFLLQVLCRVYFFQVVTFNDATDETEDYLYKTMKRMARNAIIPLPSRNKYCVYLFIFKS